MFNKIFIIMLITTACSLTDPLPVDPVSPIDTHIAVENAFRENIMGQFTWHTTSLWSTNFTTLNGNNVIFCNAGDAKIFSVGTKSFVSIIINNDSFDGHTPGALNQVKSIVINEQHLDFPTRLVIKTQNTAIIENGILVRSDALDGSSDRLSFFSGTLIIRNNKLSISDVVFGNKI